jgi:hypothetical protein
MTQEFRQPLELKPTLTTSRPQSSWEWKSTRGAPWWWRRRIMRCRGRHGASSRGAFPGWVETLRRRGHAIHAIHAIHAVHADYEACGFGFGLCRAGV